MPIVQFTRFKTDKAEDGPDCQAGEEGLLKTRCRISSAVPFPHWPVGRRVLVRTRYSSWEVYGKVQEAVAKDPEFAQLQAEGMKIAELQGRNIAVGIDL